MDQERRNALLGLALGVGFLATMKCGWTQDFLPKSDSAEEIRRRQKTFKTTRAGQVPTGAVGCLDLSTFNGAEGMPQGLSLRSGIDWFDHILSQELGVMWQVFQLQPAVFFFDDGGSGNALATMSPIGGGTSPYGTVLMGRTLVYSLLEKYRGRSPISSGEHALGAVMAHEWAHIAQFASRWSTGPGKMAELHADFMAGWYMGGRYVSNHGQWPVNFAEAAEELFLRGDFSFNAPDHHGTPQERVMAYTGGANVAIQGVLRTANAYQLGKQFVSRI